MTKQTQMYVGIGVVAIAGYFIWKLSKMKPKTNFMNLTAAAPDCGPAGEVSTTTGCGCPPTNGTKPRAKGKDGTTFYPNGHTCCGGVTGPCPPTGGAGGTKDKGFVGNNSRVFKGDKSFVGDRM